MNYFNKSYYIIIDYLPNNIIICTNNFTRETRDCSILILFIFYYIINLSAAGTHDIDGNFSHALDRSSSVRKRHHPNRPESLSHCVCFT